MPFSSKCESLLSFRGELVSLLTFPLGWTFSAFNQPFCKCKCNKSIPTGQHGSLNNDKKENTYWSFMQIILDQREIYKQMSAHLLWLTILCSWLLTCHLHFCCPLLIIIVRLQCSPGYATEPLTNPNLTLGVDNTNHNTLRISDKWPTLSGMIECFGKNPVGGVRQRKTRSYCLLSLFDCFWCVGGSVQNIISWKKHWGKSGFAVKFILEPLFCIFFIWLILNLC